MDISLSVLLEVLSRGSATGAAILIIWALMTERLVPRGRLDDCIKSRERLIEQRDELLDQRDSLLEQRDRLVKQQQREIRKHAATKEIK